MKITKLNFISLAAKEAELIVRDGVHECLAFSQPCNKNLNENLTEPMHAMDVENLMIALDQNTEVKILKTKESYFSHYCIAKVSEIDKSIVSIGGLRIQLESNIPSWAKNGDLIEFKCSRLDVW